MKLFPSSKHENLSIAQMAALPQPRSMGPRHVPIPHVDVYNMTRSALERGGYEVKWEDHQVGGPDNSEYFGCLGIASRIPDDNSQERTRMVGLRNANNQRFRTQLAAGDMVMVCANMCFSGELVVGRKHTVNQRDDFQILLDKTVDFLGISWDNQSERVKRYKEIDLTTKDADHIVCEAMRKGALPSSKITRVLDEYVKPSHDDFGDRNLWSLFNAYTEIGKAFNPEDLQNRSMSMIQICDQLSGHQGIKPIISVEDTEKDDVVVVAE